MDMLDGAPHPRRGDRLTTTKTLYYVLAARVVKRRDPNAVVRAALTVAKADEMEPELRHALLRSAIRRGASLLYRFKFYPRTKKKHPEQWVASDRLQIRSSMLDR